MIPVGFIVLKAGVMSPDRDVSREVVARVRDELGPVAAFKSVHVVKALPKTRSGKTLRATIRSIANGESVSVPATIEDPAADRKRVVEGKSVSVRVELGGSRIFKKKTTNK